MSENRLMSSIRVISTDVERDGVESTAIVVVLEEEQEGGAAVLLSEDEANTLIRQIETARDFALKVNLARRASPEARA
jgi:hypothetical protein